MSIRIKLPLDRSKISGLRAGERVLLSGHLYTARDAAHMKLKEMLDNGHKLPVDLNNETIYYAGPCPAAPGRVIGSAGPTTSGRMDSYTPALLEHGLIGMIGKGDRDDKVVEAIKAKGAVYFGATGGAGALLSGRIVSSEIAAFPELGTEAIRRIEVVDFPVIVLIDPSGTDIYRTNVIKYRNIREEAD